MPTPWMPNFSGEIRCPLHFIGGSGVQAIWCGVWDSNGGKSESRFLDHPGRLRLQVAPNDEGEGVVLRLCARKDGCGQPALIP